MSVISSATFQRLVRGSRLVSVAIKCDRCRRQLLQVAGNEKGITTARRGLERYVPDAGPFWGANPGQGAPYRFECKCGARFSVRAEKLDRAFRAAAGRTEARKRVVLVPADLAGV